MKDPLAEIVNLADCPLASDAYRVRCKQVLDAEGVLVLPGFLRSAAVEGVRREGGALRHLAHHAGSEHNVYLTPSCPDFPARHPSNRTVVSSKGCITTDQVPATSALRVLYDAPAFRAFLCAVLDEVALFEYADPLSSVNLHYADEGQELGWHFDNSSFAITLMIQNPQAGGVFEYVKEARDADRGEMNYELAGRILDGIVATQSLTMNAGALVLFRGRNSMHRVTPVEGARTRMLAVLAYNTEPGISLSESARMTFYGRLGT